MRPPSSTTCSQNQIPIVNSISPAPSLAQSHYATPPDSRVFGRPSLLGPPAHLRSPERSPSTIEWSPLTPPLCIPADLAVSAFRYAPRPCAALPGRRADSSPYNCRLVSAR